MTLRESVEELQNEQLEEIMQEHIDWEKNSHIPNSSHLREMANKYYGNDMALSMERVATEVFRVYALRAAGMR